MAAHFTRHPASTSEADEMSAKDHMVWRLESGRRARPIIVVVLFFEDDVSWEAFTAWHESLCAAMPRLRGRVAPGRRPGERPRWVPDENFSLLHHLQRVAVEGKGTRRDVFDAAEVLAEVPFPQGRSPWNGYLISGLEGGRTGYVLKISHSIADGIRLREIFLRQSVAETAAHSSGTPAAEGPWQVISPMPAAEVPPPRTEQPVPPSPHGRRLLKAARFLGRATLDMLDLPHPVPEAGGQFRRHFFTTTVPLPPVKQLATASGGTVHDALVAAVTEGCRRYNTHHGVRRRRMRVFSPYGRPPRATAHDSRSQGNHWFIVRFAVRAELPDLPARIRAVRRAVRDSYHPDSADWMGAIARLCPLVPRALFEAVFLRLCATHEFVVSNMPGPTVAASVNGHRVGEIYAIAPTLGSAVTVTLMSYQDTCHIAVNVDPTVIPDSHLVAHHICQAVRELADPAAPRAPGSGKTGR
ncbi:wax ester/triacylglycerol synthase domain-containing protein [Streptomyces sp. SCL15-4]|uniref:wax ester/triacylglycerol synthase domain-containing protein n=1 Tax=Streptomyces sp. SCL15-4 TaxID=2967221 RepID=UPI0029674BBC|nr:wax ester/triacylglycerol synthase domain-containing protein [Streptomyces sp. SCL15-4]